MTDIQLNAGELWELAGERHYLEQVMGSGFLLFRSERTSAPFQIELDSGEKVSPTMDWLKDEFLEGNVRRLDRPCAKSRLTRLTMDREDDYDAIIRRDPYAAVRHMVLNALDLLPGLSLSDKGIRRALATIWTNKQHHLEGRRQPSPTSVRRWLKTRGEPGFRPLRSAQSMRGQGPRITRLPDAVVQLMKEAAAAYWSDPRETIASARDLLGDAVAKINRDREEAPLKPPSKEAFRLYVHEQERYDTVAAKWGKKEANTRFKPCGKGLVASRPLLLGAMDHTLLDVFVVVDVKGWRLLGRPTLTALIDVHSRCILGWVLSFEPPSLYSVTECIKRANRPKAATRERFPDTPELADIFGKFDEIVVDNGWEFTGTSTESALTDLGISIRWAPVRSPTYKAVIERFFGTLNLLLNKKLPGGTIPIEQMRAWELNPSKDAVLTLAEVEALLTSAIGTYHQELHSTLGDTPLHIWTKGVRDHGVQVIGDDAQLDKMVGAHEERTLSRSGVSLFDLQFHEPAVTGPLLEKLAGRTPRKSRRKGSATAKVTVKYNPANLGEVHIWDPTTGQYETLPCTDPDYASGLSKWHHQQIQQWERESQGIDAEGRRNGRLELRREIEAASPEHLLRRNRRTAARLLSPPHVEASASQHLRVAHANPRHDGMAPVISTTALAPERTDGHAKPVRPPRGRKAKAPSRTRAAPAAPPTNEDFQVIRDDSAGWEEFQ